MVETEDFDEVERCGIFPFSTDWPRDLLGLGPDPFLSACVAHDRKYVKKEAPRKVVDQCFLNHMLLLANNRVGDNRNLIRMAKIYYKIARALGWIPWYWSLLFGERKK